jgi:hypothetical protein
MRSVVPCVACGGSLSLFGRRSDYEYYRCSMCGTIQLAPPPSQQELAEAYATEYAAAGHYEQDPDACNLSARTYYQAIIKTLKDYQVEGAVLDYGAGWGGLCEMLIGNGFQCRGTEMSHDMVTYCQRRGLPVQYGDITTLEGKKFSALVLCTVFEHLIEHDNWMARANQLLKQDGLLVTLQPTARFADFMGRILRLGNLQAPLPRLHQVFCPPWHTVFFSLDGMRTLVSRHGFDLLEIRPAPQGRARGLTGLAQRCLELVSRFGWHLMGERWPLLTAHIFVLRKVHDVT